ncbi:MAG: hypothetical protein Tsb0021_14900 [Chlamydiales bacterium]
MTFPPIDNIGLVTQYPSYQLGYSHFEKKISRSEYRTLAFISIVAYPLIFFVGLLGVAYTSYQMRRSDMKMKYLFKVLNQSESFDDFLLAKMHRSISKIEKTKREIIYLIDYEIKPIPLSLDLPTNRLEWNCFEWENLMNYDFFQHVDHASDFQKEALHDLVAKIIKLDCLIKQKNAIIQNGRFDEATAKKIVTMDLIKQALATKELQQYRKIFCQLLFPNAVLKKSFESINDQNSLDNSLAEFEGLAQLEEIRNCGSLVDAHNLILRSTESPLLPYIAQEIKNLK